MARLFSSGFEMNSNTAGMEWDNVVQPTVATVVTSPVRSGTYAGRIQANVGNVVKFGKQFLASDGNGPYFARTYFRYATLPNAKTGIMFFENAAGNGKGIVKINTDATLVLEDQSSPIGQPSMPLSANTWYRIELGYRNNTASGKLELAAKLDGNFFAIGTSIFTGGVNKVNVGMETISITSADLYYDDFALNDSLGGSYEISYPGDGSIVHLAVDSAGDNNGWNQGTATSYTEVDESPTPDDITTYIAEDTSGVISDFNLAATPAAIATDSAIRVVQVGARFANSDASSVGRFVLRIKPAAAGTTNESSPLNPGDTTWVTNGNVAPKNYQLTSYVQPGTSTAWTKAVLDTAQIGVRVSTSASGDTMRVSTLWLLVEYYTSPTVLPKIQSRSPIRPAAFAPGHAR